MIFRAVLIDLKPILGNEASRGKGMRLEAEAQANQSFDPSMVLLDDIVIWHV